MKSKLKRVSKHVDAAFLDYGKFAAQYGYRNRAKFFEACYQVWFGITTTIAGCLALALSVPAFFLYLLINLLSANSWNDLKNKYKKLFDIRTLLPFLYCGYMLYAGLVNVFQVILLPFKSILGLSAWFMGKKDYILQDQIHSVQNISEKKRRLWWPLWKGAHTLEQHFQEYIRSYMEESHIHRLHETQHLSAEMFTFPKRFKSQIMPLLKQSFSISALNASVAPYQSLHEVKGELFAFLKGLKDIVFAFTSIGIILVHLPIELSMLCFTCHSWKALFSEVRRVLYNSLDTLLSNLFLGIIAFSQLRHLFLIPVRGIATGVRTCFRTELKQDLAENEGSAQDLKQVHASATHHAIPPLNHSFFREDRVPRNPVLVYDGGLTPASTDEVDVQDDFVKSILGSP